MCVSKNNLFLYRVEIEVFLPRNRLVAVWVHDDRQVLVDETYGEHVSVFAVRRVQELDCIA